jgi:hypothetical protein
MRGQSKRRGLPVPRVPQYGVLLSPSQSQTHGKTNRAEKTHDAEVRSCACHSHANHRRHGAAKEEPQAKGEGEGDE